MTGNPWRPDNDEKDNWRDDLNYYSNDSDQGRHHRNSSPRYMRLVVFLLGILLLFGGLAIAFPGDMIDTAYLIRGLVIIVIFGGAAVLWSQSSLLRLAKIAGLWVAIIGALSAVYLYKTDFNNSFMSAVDPSGISETEDGLIVHRSKDGHFWLRAYANNVPIRMMVDTGASNIVLSPEDAERIGMQLDDLSFNGIAHTANGEVSYARAKIDHIAFGDTRFNDVPVTVNGAKMNGSLLGLSVLNEFSSIEFRGDIMILRP
ncbi:TIGR02281 family clan AA aspartic protease [Kordiimonas sp. SCSIO 12610]|uniref:retropepsin-like aspartic protease family protein n=1 Tax=Kordiimonas sp. SCSIO 12610 TaxID=2829597 RepID=UPI00210E3FB4|nr:TIGR02281 family clan AA aspartic protease [Kordiimonas sp. SCSIO 12610]UTW53942.1 TIGR02281 family clan AA aspartic protease [Kordiimonas sp. SCSIO 12610]